MIKAEFQINGVKWIIKKKCGGNWVSSEGKKTVSLS